MSAKKAILKKKIQGEIYDLFLKTSVKPTQNINALIVNLEVE